MTRTPGQIASFRQEVGSTLLDLNRRDRLELMAELDRMLAELPPDAAPAVLGEPAVVARMLRDAAGQPTRLRWSQRLWRASWRFKVGVATVVLVTGLASWYGTAAGRYELELGGFGYGPAEPDELRTAGHVEEAVYTYRPGRTIKFGFSLRNSGRFPVTLTSAFSTSEGSYLVVDEVRIGPASGSSPNLPATAAPLGHAAIAPGEDRAIWVAAHLANCDQQAESYSAGSRTGIGVARLQFRVRDHRARTATRAPDACHDPV
jgi:hypothetical protein